VEGSSDGKGDACHIPFDVLSDLKVDGEDPIIFIFILHSIPKFAINIPILKVKIT
jgi:hypothetical protein